jgi:hypothetical protein
MCCNNATNPPVLPAQGNRTVNQFSVMTVTNTASDSNGIGDPLTYALQNPPAGAQINTNGIITWTPGSGQAPSTNLITTIVTDLYSLSATNSFTVVVNDVNTPPALPAQSNRSIVGLTSLVVTNTATDTNVPPASLTYALLVAPTNASISANGIITWNPVVSQVPSTNVFTTVVTNFNPLALVNQHLTATNSFTVTDLPLHNPPVLPAQSNRTILAQTTLVVTNTATANDMPPLTLTYSLLVAPSGASISTSGVITWTPPGSPSNTTNTITTVVQDNGSPKLSATNSFSVVAIGDQTCQYVAIFTQNFDGVTHPALPTNWTTVASGVESNWITVTNVRDTLPNSAFAPDVPNIGESDLVSPTVALPTGQNLLIFRNDYNLEYNLTKPTDGYDGGVLEIKIGTNAFADVITAGGNFNSGGYNATIDGAYFNPLTNRPAWSANSGGFITTSVTLPASASGQNIQLRWRVGCDNGNVASGTPGWWIDSVVISNVVCGSIGPILSAQPDRTINEFATLTVTNAATTGTPPLTYTLLNPPAGAGINSSGVITWTPAEGQGPSTNTVTTVVTDSESTPRSATNGFSVVVMDVNVPPTLPAQPDVTIAGLSTLVVTNTGSDSNIPPASLSYGFLAAPTNAAIDTNGVITWTPVAAQVPSMNVFTTAVTNFNPYAQTNQRLTATNTFTVTVTTVHNGPSLGVIANQTVNEFSLLTVVNTATDTDVPVLGLTYQLLNPPANASISGNGTITWTPGEGQGPSTNIITTSVSDNGIPPLSATNSFVVVVNDVNVPPALPAQTNQTIVGLATLAVTNTASDSNIPAATLSYGFLAAPTNAAIDTNGVITWTPVEAQVPSTNVFTTVVTNFNPYAQTNQRLTATNSFTVTVNAIHNGPSLAAQADQTVDEFALLTVVNTASDTDVPALALSYRLLNAPAGANIDSNGVITWTPTEGQGPGTNTLTTVVQDTGTPSLSATNSFVVTVNDVNVPPVLPEQTNQTIVALATLVVTNTASDPNIPATTLSYGLLAAPTNAVIDSNGIITWTPVVAQVPSTNTFATVVTNFNPYVLVNQRLTATNTFVVIVASVHNGPSLSALSNRTVNEFAQLVVTNTATDSDIPPFPLNYLLLNPPASASIDENGIITWTPDASQAGTTNSIVTVVTDQGLPPLSATNSFMVMVNPPPPPPVILSISVSNAVAWITWSSTAGYSYQLQFKNNFSDTNWTPADTSVRALGDSLTSTNVSTGSMQRFYRVMIVPGD